MLFARTRNKMKKEGTRMKKEKIVGKYKQIC
jgi:hypothetical protein